MINSFTGKYFFLSNFYEAPVKWKGITYKNNEAAFQSAKVLDKTLRKEFSNLDPSSAKRKGRQVKLRPGWDKIKFDIMYDICYEKFSQNEDLKIKLLNTGEEHLEEGNDWGDEIWGTVKGKGQNLLGRILMEVRDELREEC